MGRDENGTTIPTWVFGCTYRLVVAEASGTRQAFELTADKRIMIIVPKGSTAFQKACWMQEWYRKNLEEKAQPRVQKWADDLHLPLPRCGIEKMKTKREVAIQTRG